jgi:hypothetical protein
LSDIKKNVGSAQFGTFLHKNAHFGPSNNANIMQIFEAKTIAKVLPIKDLFFNVETWQH